MKVVYSTFYVHINPFLLPSFINLDVVHVYGKFMQSEKVLVALIVCLTS